MKNSVTRISCIAMVMAMMTASMPAFAQKSATPTNYKVGYFNLVLIKQVFPEASDSLKNNAESQLRAFLEDANKKLQKMQEDKKPDADIKKAQADLQTELAARQQALGQLVQTQAFVALQSIARAVNQVAKKRDLDLVIDASGVYSGNEKVVSNGVDITDDVIKELQPPTLRTAGTGGTK